MAWAAVRNQLESATWLVFAATVCWAIVYDTIYAHQDKEDDALIGIKSTARLFGEETPRFLLIFLVISVGLMGAAVIGALLETASVLALTVALGGPWAFGWHLSWQMRALDIDNPDLCLRLFRSNRDAGLIFALFLAIALVL